MLYTHSPQEHTGNNTLVGSGMKCLLLYATDVQYKVSHRHAHTHLLFFNNRRSRFTSTAWRCCGAPREKKIWHLMNNPISTWKVTSGLFQKQSFFCRRAICFLDEWVPLPTRWATWGECTLHHSFGICAFSLTPSHPHTHAISARFLGRCLAKKKKSPVCSLCRPNHYISVVCTTSVTKSLYIVLFSIFMFHCIWNNCAQGLHIQTHS